jgi:hypothetical protein
MPPAYYYRCDKQGRVNEGPRCHPNHIRSGPLDELVWQEVRRHLLDPELLLKAQTTLMSTESLDESFLITQLNNTRKRLSQTQGERRRLLDAFQGGFITKEEFEERTRNVSSRIENLQADLKAVAAETKNVSAGRELFTRISDFTKTLTEKLNDMTFHEKQQLVRTVLQEVVIKGNTAKLFFKIPLPKKKVTAPSGNDSPHRKTVSSQFDLRSRADDVMNVGMIAQVAGPGLEHADQAHSTADESGIKSELQQSLRRGAKEQVVDGLLMGAGHGS